MDVPTGKLLENIGKNIPVKLKRKKIKQEQKNSGSQVSCYAVNEISVTYTESHLLKILFSGLCTGLQKYWIRAQCCVLGQDT